MKPLGNKVLIQPDSPTNVSEGGILLANPKTPDTGVVIEVSTDTELQVEKGDRVKFLLGQGLQIEGLLLIEEHNILFKYDK